MIIRSIQFLDPPLLSAAVRLVPSWWERLIGREEQDFVVVGVSSIAGGVTWLVDGQYVVRVTSRELIEAVERERVAVEKRQYANEIWSRRIEAYLNQ